MLQQTHVYRGPAKCYSIPRCIEYLLNVTANPGVWVPAKCYSIPRCMGCLLNVTPYPGVWGAF